MLIEGEALSIDYGQPKKVELEEIEAALEALADEVSAGSEVRRVFGRALTLVIYSDEGTPTEEMDQLIGRIITRTSARAICIRANPSAPRSHLASYIRAHCVIRSDNTQQCAEQVALHASDEAIQELPGAVLRLRLRDLPLIVWWRSQPDLDNPVFSALLKEADQFLLDSARFTVPTDQFAALVSRLRREAQRLPFGDLNWARLTPWRELIAQFFDIPEHLSYLSRLDEIELSYSSRAQGNPAQALLLVMWLATMLDWDVVAGSWKRKGKDRSLELRANQRPISVSILGRDDVEAPPGALCGATLYVKDRPPATFQISWCGDNCVNTQIKIGERTTERTTALNIPDEVTLVSSELDASQRDRVYHHALEVLERLLA